jgi:hypothetical protein
VCYVVGHLKGIFMPRVGKKEFSYTAKGMAAAKAEAKKTGKKMQTGKGSVRKKKMK